MGLLQWLREILKCGLTPGRSGHFDFSAADPKKVNQLILNEGGITSSTPFPAQCHLGTLAHTSSPLA